MAVLDPDVVLRSDGGDAAGGDPRAPRRAAVAERAMTFARLSPFVRPALVNGAAGVGGATWAPSSVLAFTVRDGRIVAIDGLADPDRLKELDLTVLDG